MKTLHRLRLAAGILALGAGLPVFAQISQQTQQVTVTAAIPSMLNLSVSNNNVIFFFTQRDYNKSDGTGSKEEVNATTLSVSANSPWRLDISADSENFSFTPTTAGTAASKPCGDLSLSSNGTANYQPVTVAPQELAQGEPGGTSLTGNTIPVSYKLATTLAGDPPGGYRLTLTYTLMPR